MNIVESNFRVRGRAFQSWSCDLVLSIGGDGVMLPGNVQKSQASVSPLNLHSARLKCDGNVMRESARRG